LTKLSLFKLDLRYNPSILILNVTRNELLARILKGEDFATALHTTLRRAQEQLQEVKDKQAAATNTARRKHNFRVRDEVYLNTKDLSLMYMNTAPESKLRYYFMGLFNITHIHGNAARLDMSKEL